MRIPFSHTWQIFALFLFTVIAAPTAVSKPAPNDTRGVWIFDTEDRDHPRLQYVVSGKTVFFVGCGRAFGLHAIYPDNTRMVGTHATITVKTSENTMMFHGQIDESWESDPPDTRHFRQWDLGYSRQDPELFGKKWKTLERRFLDLLDSGMPVTISAKHGNYVLPAVDAPDWKARFLEKC